ncbi:galectin-2 isoform X2 [Strigops habroptila]|nr:galectin-2 isoform X2 [Strigops habroptila]
MAPTLAPVTASWVSAVPGHALEMKQSFLHCQQCEYGCPIPVQANCPPDRMMNIYMGPCRSAPRQEEFEIFNLGLKTGESLKIKGKISDHTDGFSINLGSRSSDLAFHFNPRFNESVIVCNSRSASTWEAEHRDKHLCFSRGSSIKITIEMLEHKFLVKLPDGHEVEFPNRHCYSQINYMSVKGGFRVTSFKLD